MKKTGLIMGIMVCQIAMVAAQQVKAKQRMSFKSVTIQNGDTVVTEKNIESDDPNAQLSDSIPFGNGSFQFHFGDANSDEFFQGFNDFQFLQDPLMNDSLFSQFFSQHFGVDSSSFSPQQRFVNPPSGDAKTPSNRLFSPNDEKSYNLAEFKVAVLPEINKLNITFRLSPADVSELEIVDKNGKSVHSEKFGRSDGYYIRQIDLSKFDKGEYSVQFKQGVKVQATNIILN